MISKLTETPAIPGAPSSAPALDGLGALTPDMAGEGEAGAGAGAFPALLEASLEPLVAIPQVEAEPPMPGGLGVPLTGVAPPPTEGESGTELPKPGIAPGTVLPTYPPKIPAEMPLDLPDEGAGEGRAQIPALERYTASREVPIRSNAEGPRRPTPLTLEDAPPPKAHAPAAQVAAAPAVPEDATLRPAQLALESKEGKAMPSPTIAPIDPKLMRGDGPMAQQRPLVRKSDVIAAKVAPAQTAPANTPAQQSETEGPAEARLRTILAPLQRRDEGETRAQPKALDAMPNAAANSQGQASASQNASPAQPILAPQPTAPTGAPSLTQTEAKAPAQIETMINQLTETREGARAVRPEMTLRHAEFGAVTMRLEATGGDLRATLAARDPGFVPAVQNALAERGVVASSESAFTHNGSQSSSQQSSQNGGQHGAQHGPGNGSAQSNYGSSTGSHQGSLQPYSEQEELSEEGNGPRRMALDPQNRGASDTSGGIFA